MHNRREVRELVMKAMYATEFSGEHPDDIIQKILDPAFDSKDKKSLEFAKKLYLKALKTRGEADELIQKFLSNWKLERLANVDRIVLEMGIAELMDFEDIPTKVTINECIEIAKKYSTAKSGKFVNGILDSACQHLKDEGILKKTGRGLIERSL